MVTNPKTISWVNAVQAVDQNGNTVAWSASADLAGVQIAFDGQAAVSVPATTAITQLALASIAGYSTLAAGQHTVTVAEVTKEGAVSPPSVSASFLIALVPLAPTTVMVA